LFFPFRKEYYNTYLLSNLFLSAVETLEGIGAIDDVGYDLERKIKLLLYKKGFLFGSLYALVNDECLC
tara:strand:+ start:518 stop:721 length:204 start_codon:yes stop_codon:yes gene_type:complete